MYFIIICKNARILLYIIYAYSFDVKSCHSSSSVKVIENYHD